MADTKISNLANALALTGTETLPVVQSSVTLKTTTADVAILANTLNIQSVVSSATVTPTADNDEVVITAQAANLTLANPSGTPVQGQAMMIRIKDNGTSRTITYGSEYRIIGTVLPTATTISKYIYIGMIYNSTDTKWDVLGINEEA